MPLLIMLLLVVSLPAIAALLFCEAVASGFLGSESNSRAYLFNSLSAAVFFCWLVVLLNLDQATNLVLQILS